MNRAVRIRSLLLATMLAMPLAGCGSLPDSPDIDPTDWFAGDWFGTKKPLPGERKELFPGGVPGVARGVPSELVKGNQPPPGAEDAPPDTALVVEEPKPKPKPKAKPRPKVAAKPAPVMPASTPTSVTVRRSDQPAAQAPQQQQQPQQQQSGGVQWPDPPPPQQQRQSPSAVQWPDPPPPPR
jgi:hypothetical protein